jgi:hypothetical protein
MLMVLLLLLLLSTGRPAGANGPGVTSLTVDEALAAGIPIAFSPATALAALHARHAATLPPPSAVPHLPRASLQPHLPALRQVAQLCGSAAVLGARDSAPLWAIFLGLAEAQAAAQASRQQQQQQHQQHQQQAPPPPLPPLPRSWLHSARWAAGADSSSSSSDAPPALLLPLGRALGVDVSEGAPGAPGPWGGSSAAQVDLLLLDGARSHEAVLRDLLAVAGRVQRYIVLPHSEYAPQEGSAAEAALQPPLRTTGIKAALFDFLHLHNHTTTWDVSAHFANHAGLTLLGRRARAVA